MSTRARIEREKLQRKNSILSAAKELFWKKGYGATMDEIAEKAELSKPTIYLYFQNKDDLYVSIVLDGFQDLKERLSKIIDSDEEIEGKLRAIFLTFIDFCMETKEQFRITQFIFTDYARRKISQDLSKRLDENIDEVLGYVVKVIQEGMDQGFLRKDLNPFKLAIIAWRTMTGLLDLAVEDEIVNLGPETYRELFDTALNLLIYGAKENG